MPSRERLAAFLVVVVTLPFGWLLLASGLWTYLSHAAGANNPFSLTAWWDALALWHYNLPTKAVLVLSAVVPTVIVFAAVMTWARALRVTQVPWYARGLSLRAQQRRPVIESATDNHGHARWATMAEMRALWPGPDPAYGGVVVGEAYDPRIDRGPFKPHDQRTWGHGGRAPLLIDPCIDGSTHSLTFAASGFFKSVSLCSTALCWTGSLVILDPNQELATILAGDRRRQGHRVFVLNPETSHVAGFNALSWIDIEQPAAEMNVAAVVEWVCGPSPAIAGNAAFFTARAKALVTCLIAHVLWDKALAPELKTLRTVRVALAVPESELRLVLKQIHKNSPSPLARDLAGTLCETTDQTYSGIVSGADEMTRWLTVASFADLVCGSSFQAADIADGRTDVFVSVPLKAMISTPALARCIIGSLLNALYERDGEVTGRVCFMLDEMARLGKMAILETARDCGRKYGITIVGALQSVGQLEEAWGRDGARSWNEAVSWRSYAAITDLPTAEMLSRTIGQHGVVTWSQNAGRQGRGIDSRSRSAGMAYSEHPRALIRPEEIMTDLRSDAAIVIPKNGRPALIGRALYFRRKDLARRVAHNRFARERESLDAQ